MSEPIAMTLDGRLLHADVEDDRAFIFEQPDDENCIVWMGENWETQFITWKALRLVMDQPDALTRRVRPTRKH